MVCVRTQGRRVAAPDSLQSEIKCTDLKVAKNHAAKSPAATAPTKVHSLPVSYAGDRPHLNYSFPPPLVGAGKPSRIKGQGLDFSLRPCERADRQTKPMGGVQASTARQHEARLVSLTLCSARGMARGAPVPLGVISSSASSVQQQLEQVVQWLAAASCGFEWRRACGGGGGEC